MANFRLDVAEEDMGNKGEADGQSSNNSHHRASLHGLELHQARASIRGELGLRGHVLGTWNPHQTMNLKNLAIIASITIPLEGLIIWGIVCLWRFIASL